MASQIRKQDILVQEGVTAGIRTYEFGEIIFSSLYVYSILEVERNGEP